LQKGDDAEISPALHEFHALRALDAIACVTLKVDYNLPPYHAGRFTRPDRLIIDPIRVVLKHLTRLRHDDVSTRTYYESFVSRNIRYTAEDYEYLTHALPARYTAYDSEDIDLLLRIAVSMQRWSYFKMLHDCPEVHVVLRVISFRSDCASGVARVLFPHRGRGFHRQFSGLTQDKLVTMLRYHGVITHSLHSNTLPLVSDAGVYVSQSHCYLVT